ncbi:MAG: hypothetical protein AAGL17_06285 [Cyanobacteria bacterium J06576_12]
MIKFLNPLYLYRRWRYKRWLKAHLQNNVAQTPLFQDGDVWIDGMIVSERK